MKLSGTSPAQHRECHGAAYIPMKKVYRIGYVGVFDDTPLLIAHSQGWLTDGHFTIELSRELGWAAMLVKLSAGALAGANVSALYPALHSLTSSKGTHGAIEALGITSYGGLSLTVSPSISGSLEEKKKLSSPLRIGVSPPRGDAQLFLSAWQNSVGIAAGDVVLVSLAASQFVSALAEGYVAGIVASQPMTALAEDQAGGITIARSHDFYPYHPRSALVARSSFVELEPAPAELLRSALTKAADFCSSENRWNMIWRLFNPPALETSLPDEHDAQIAERRARLGEHTFFSRPQNFPDSFDVSTADFIRRACLTTDPGLRDVDIRAAITHVYSGVLKLPTPKVEARPALR